MTVILGLNAYHADASAALIIDGKVVSAIAEERLAARQKHVSGFPRNAISTALSIAGLTGRDIDVIAVGHNPRANITSKAKYAVQHPKEGFRQALNLFRKHRSGMDMAQLVEEAAGTLKASVQVRNVEHHVAHIASSFYTSGFEEASAFSYDASGDFVSAMYAECSEGSIRPVKRIFLPNSLGYFYTAITQFIGFSRFGEEYKVMGLAAYGEAKYMSLMQRMLSYQGSGNFLNSQDYFSGLLPQRHDDLQTEGGEILLPPLYSERIVEEMGPARGRTEEISSRDRNLAASAQKHFEDVTIECVRWLRSNATSSNLVTAGGCALNGLCNSSIQRLSGYKNFHIHGAAGDDGTAVGAALAVSRELTGSAPVERQYAAYLGQRFSSDHIARAFAARDLTAVRCASEHDLITSAATLVADGKVVGWFQGRSEWGPRALGNRSILANPAHPQMKQILNSKIKRRESYRPFAPSVIASAIDRLFEQSVDSPFMMHVVKFREPDLFPSVAHVDGTGRVQTVSQELNDRYSKLILAVAERTGHPVVLNTSFNENEPIVETPEQAIDCFLRTDMDALVIEDYVIEK